MTSDDDDDDDDDDDLETFHVPRLMKGGGGNCAVTQLDSVLDALPVWQPTLPGGGGGENPDTMCQICQENLVQSPCLILPCFHIFHRQVRLLLSPVTQCLLSPFLHTHPPTHVLSCSVSRCGGRHLALVPTAASAWRVTMRRSRFGGPCRPV